MKSHIIPTNKILKQLPFTYGTKNLKSNNSPEVIAREIIILTTSCKTQTNRVILPRIVPWYDKLNEKATRVNKHLKKNMRSEIFALFTTETFLQNITVAEVGYI